MNVLIQITFNPVKITPQYTIMFWSLRLIKTGQIYGVENRQGGTCYFLQNGILIIDTLFSDYNSRLHS